MTSHIWVWSTLLKLQRMHYVARTLQENATTHQFKKPIYNYLIGIWSMKVTVVGDQLKLLLWQLEFHLCIICYGILSHFVVVYMFLFLEGVCLCIVFVFYSNYTIVYLLRVASIDGLWPFWQPSTIWNYLLCVNFHRSLWKINSSSSASSPGIWPLGVWQSPAAVALVSAAD